jgi:D-alanyl-D-alanine carboxypeptidase (penicillin-binding protein 5/6)
MSASNRSSSATSTRTGSLCPITGKGSIRGFLTVAVCGDLQGQGMSLTMTERTAEPTQPMRPRTPPPSRRPGRAVAALAGLLVVGLLFALMATRAAARPAGPPGAEPAWPASGQAALDVAGRGRLGTSGDGRPVPIASLAKVMTAYVVLRRYPLRGSEAGFTIVITRSEVRDADRRRSEGQSGVRVRAGERISERQALEGLLLPSANNLAAVLATRAAGSPGAFVTEMNASARRLGMTRTTYTDPSGYDPGTVSTAGDQAVLAATVMRIPVIAAIVREPSATIPVAGQVRNTDALLGQDGFVGLKTGSDQAAGGCFMFAAVRRVQGRPVLVTGAVLGQRGRRLIPAGLRAADRLVVSVGQ